MTGVSQATVRQLVWAGSGPGDQPWEGRCGDVGRPEPGVPGVSPWPGPHPAHLSRAGMGDGRVDRGTARPTEDGWPDDGWTMAGQEEGGSEEARL